MDTIRHYYASENMTATPFRLEYIYTFTHEAECLMRRFLVETAAVRCVAEGGVSAALRGVLSKQEEMEGDFMDALIRVGKEEYVDARHGPECAWHRHEVTQACVAEPAEAWQSTD